MSTESDRWAQWRKTGSNPESKSSAVKSIEQILEEAGQTITPPASKARFIELTEESAPSLAYFDAHKGQAGEICYFYRLYRKALPWQRLLPHFEKLSLTDLIALHHKTWYPSEQKVLIDYDQPDISSLSEYMHREWLKLKTKPDEGMKNFIIKEIIENTFKEIAAKTELTPDLEHFTVSDVIDEGANILLALKILVIGQTIADEDLEGWLEQLKSEMPDFDQLYDALITFATPEFQNLLYKQKIITPESKSQFYELLTDLLIDITIRQSFQNGKIKHFVLFPYRSDEIADLDFLPHLVAAHRDFLVEIPQYVNEDSEYVLGKLISATKDLIGANNYNHVPYLSKVALSILKSDILAHEFADFNPNLIERMIDHLQADLRRNRGNEDLKAQLSAHKAQLNAYKKVADETNVQVLLDRCSPAVADEITAMYTAVEPTIKHIIRIINFYIQNPGYLNKKNSVALRKGTVPEYSSIRDEINKSGGKRRRKAGFHRGRYFNAE